MDCGEMSSPIICCQVSCESAFTYFETYLRHFKACHLTDLHNASALNESESYEAMPDLTVSDVGVNEYVDLMIYL